MMVRKTIASVTFAFMVRARTRARLTHLKNNQQRKRRVSKKHSCKGAGLLLEHDAKMCNGPRGG